MKKNQKGLPANATHQALQAGFAQIILILIFVAIGVVIGFYIKSFKDKPNLSVIVPTPSPIVSAQPVVDPTVKPTSDPTANWKTYENSNAQISYKYPSQLTEVEGEGGSYISGPITGKSNLVIGFEDKSTVYPNTDATYDGFTVYEIDPGLTKNFTIDSYLNDELSAVKISPRGIQTATIEKVALGNQTFWYIDSEANIRRYFIVSSDHKRMAIFSRINSSPKFPQTFDQVLSTFQFTK